MPAGLLTRVQGDLHASLPALVPPPAPAPLDAVAAPPPAPASSSSHPSSGHVAIDVGGAAPPPAYALVAPSHAVLSLPPPFAADGAPPGYYAGPAPPPPPAYPVAAASSPPASGDPPRCRICQQTGWLAVPFLSDAKVRASEQLVSPCACPGPRRFVHVRCLSTWSATHTPPADAPPSQLLFRCEVCRHEYAKEKRARASRLLGSHALTALLTAVLLLLLVFALGAAHPAVVSDSVRTRLTDTYGFSPLGIHALTGAVLLGLLGFCVLLLTLLVAAWHGGTHAYTFCYCGTGGCDSGGDCGGDGAAIVLGIAVVVGLVAVAISGYILIYRAVHHAMRTAATGVLNVPEQPVQQPWAKEAFAKL